MSEIKIKAVKNHDLDNVATIFGSGTEKGSKVEVADPKGNIEIYESLDEIPFGHKIALCNISSKEQITKYGEEIGVATKDIQVGEHVHVHNIDSIRGRGDWDREGGTSK